jgi:hypothetical protein
MPVLTLAELVVDQAIGIAIGVAAIVAAPKAGPKLASLSHDLSDAVKLAMIPAASATGRAIVGKATGGVRWYGQQVSGLIDEATTEPAAARIRQGERPLLCSFNFKIPNDPVAILDMVKPMIKEAGGTVVGENADVTFSIPTVVGRFDGACTLVEPLVINIAVTDKPDIVSCKMVRDQLAKYITQAVVMYREQSNGARAAHVTNGETSDGRRNGTH